MQKVKIQNARDEIETVGRSSTKNQVTEDSISKYCFNCPTETFSECLTALMQGRKGCLDTLDR